MNIEKLRQSLKAEWLGYYKRNREWLARLGVWVDCDGQRRPSSSFILATLSILEPRLTKLLPLVVELNNHPDRIVAALGLNFNPETELEAWEAARSGKAEAHKMLPGGTPRSHFSASAPPQQLAKLADEACRGSRDDWEAPVAPPTSVSHGSLRQPPPPDQPPTAAH
ncbi:DUF5331 domain-containing protein [Geitlerinema sp. PCC 7407]|uniref:DUF5331 domain-containing protein n=1 Tax=Geitlerinema sp. PCC 7407 TaxID=1173025 RepID=UPI00029FA6B9|nr:DUF5331 domain-containing protein [Geitlerinema sp. PCC 7407]AFY65187.1 hypothetical protein GEI7407_0689 [Geitlerinema sp. PCC 7407]